ncbi:MAG: biotin--[acetyl-CoA-carboxylase] ligase [Planctomycetota bacterium]
MWRWTLSEPGLRDWEFALKARIARCQHFQHLVLYESMRSTQDCAVGKPPGTVVTTLHQYAGRGQRGRHWFSAADAGLAATFVLPHSLTRERSIGAAVATAHAIESHHGRPVGIKWPNDIIMDGRKVAGVLIEQSATALIGIGINVGATSWPASLRDQAGSLEDAGCSISRLEMLETLMTAVDAVESWPIERIVTSFQSRDVLTGGWSTFSDRGSRVKGRVCTIDPIRGIEIEMKCGERRFLDASTTRVIQAGLVSGR